jgi:hypothetical protein
MKRKFKQQTCAACQDLHALHFEVNLITRLGVIALVPRQMSDIINGF